MDTKTFKSLKFRHPYFFIKSETYWPDSLCKTSFYSIAKKSRWRVVSDKEKRKWNKLEI